jgi:hypothetical protein
MKTVIGFAFVCLLVTFVACRQDDNQYNPYPVWILNVHVVEEVSDIGIPFAPVHGCPQAIYHSLPNSPDSTVDCYNQTNVVKAWEHIEGTVTIEYYIHCPNYYDSDPRQWTFHAENAVRGPGRDGPEDIKVDTVALVPL